MRDRTEPQFPDAEHLATLLEAAPDALVIADEAGQILLVNARVEELFGFAREELLGRPVETLIPRGLHGAHTETRRAYAAGPWPARAEGMVRRRDGGEFPIEVTLSAVPTKDGLLVMSAIRDITARRNASAANSKLAAIVSSSYDAIIGETLDGVITSWNPAAQRMYGYRIEEAIGMPGAMLAPTEFQRQEQREMLALVAAGDAVEQLETTRITKDGRLLDIDLTSSPLRDARGRIVGVSSVCRDITERKRAEAALVEAREQFRYAFEASPVGMVLLDLDCRFVQINDAFCEIVGRPRAQLLGTRFDSLTHPDDVEHEREGIFAVLAGEHRSYVSEKRCLHASGQEISVGVNLTALRHPGGEPMRLLAHVQDITDRKRHERQLVYLSDHDALTGLPNRRAFARLLSVHGAIVERYGQVGTLLLIDLDDFRSVNQALGRLGADKVLVAVARVLAARLRRSDILARLGGDKFGVLLPLADTSAARVVANDLLATLRSETVRIAGRERPLAASIGIATFDGESGGGDVLVNADLALWDAKQGPRNRYVVFQRAGTGVEGSASAEPQDGPVKGRITWANRVQAALADERFTLLAQPVVHLLTGRTQQYELLLRMRDEHGALIRPDSFLYTTEQLGLIGQIDSWVVSRAIAMLAEPAVSAAGIALEVNLSGASIGDPRLLDQIEHELAEHNVDPARLIFEITELAALGTLPEAAAFGERLARLDCRFALDDFGAGFGSFYYLKHLHFDLIKIDGELVRGCRSRKIDRLLIEAIVDIAGGLGTETVGELVPDGETIALISRLGVDYGQGDHLGAPAPLLTQISGTRRGPRADGTSS